MYTVHCAWYTGYAGTSKNIIVCSIFDDGPLGIFVSEGICEVDFLIQPPPTVPPLHPFRHSSFLILDVIIILYNIPHKFNFVFLSKEMKCNNHNLIHVN